MIAQILPKLSQKGLPVVVDGDALTVISKIDPTLLIAGGSGERILTPHIGELARLLGASLLVPVLLALVIILLVIIFFSFVWMVICYDIPEPSMIIILSFILPSIRLLLPSTTMTTDRSIKEVKADLVASGREAAKKY